MQESSDTKREQISATALDVALRLGAVFVLVAWCFTIVAPFIAPVVWAMIIAVALTGPYEGLSARLGNRRGLAAALIVLLGILALVVPAVFLTETLIHGAQRFAERVANDDVQVPPPPAGVAGWPFVGERLHGLWELASQNLEAALVQLAPQLKTLSRALLAGTASVGGGLLQFVLSLIIAGFMLRGAHGRQAALQGFATRLVGERGAGYVTLAESTARSVARGIIGVALIQAVLAGVGLIVAGVPGAGLWAFLVLVAAVVQLPVLLVLIPPVAILFAGDASTVVAVLFLVWCLFVSLLDNVLKPILFGRGSKVPTLVIFLGAIGGMLSMGIIGLFVGAVVLALGFELLKAWMGDGAVGRAEATAEAGG